MTWPRSATPTEPAYAGEPTRDARDRRPGRTTLVPYRAERSVHPGAWWLWALGLAVAASRTTNPLLLGLIIAVAGFVVVNRRSDAPWALAFRMYVILGAFIVGVRVGFRLLFGGTGTGPVLFDLPELDLPWVDVHLFGPVLAGGVLGGFYDGLRLATMVVCVGAANALANPKRMLKAVPGALYEVGTAVVVALSVAPQLVESAGRVRRARRLRSGTGGRGVRMLRSVAIPVLQDALDRSLALAAAMDSRGYGRTGSVPRRARILTGAALVTGLAGVCVGAYGLLDATAPGYLGLPVLFGGTGMAGAGFVLGGRRVDKTVYRPDRWRAAELAVLACGAAAAVSVFLAGGADLYPSLSPLAWPTVAVLPTVGVLIAALPALLAPPPPSLIGAAA